MKKNFNDTDVEKDKNDYEVHFNLGKIMFYEKKYDIAVEEFNKALNLSPDNPNCHLEIGKCYLLGGNIDLAVKNLEQAIKLNSNYADAHYFLGVAYLSLNNYDKAINELKEALNINPMYKSPKNLIKRLFKYKGGVNKPLSELMEKNDIYDENDLSKEANVHFNLGNTYFQNGLLSEALKEYKKAIHSKPNYPDLRNKIGELYIKKEMYIEAIEEFKHALSINPKYITAVLNLGIAYSKYADELIKKSQKAFIDVLLMDPMNEKAKFYLEKIKTYNEVEFL